MHLIIGSLTHLGRGFAEVIGNAVAAWQFSNHPDAQHFVVEPSATNDLAIRAALRAGGGHLLDFGEVQLPHKRARVFALARSALKGAPGSSHHPKPHAAALDVASSD
jgi:RimJ/RimL family protein N-acetyltransferase